MKNDIRRRLKDILMLNRVTVNSISQSTAEQRRLNRQINEDSTITVETISSIMEIFPELDANWLITGKGDMYKKNEAIADAYEIPDIPVSQVAEPESEYSMVSYLKVQIKEQEEQIKQLTNAVNKLIDTNDGLMAINSKLNDVLMNHIVNKKDKSKSNTA